MTRETRTAKVERFCIEVVRPGNSLSDAYRIAFKPKNCTAKTINEMASRLRKTGKVDARIAELMAPIATAAQDEKTRWLEKVRRCAMFDVRKMFDSHGNPIEIKDLDDDSAPAIAGFEFFEEFAGKGESRIAVGYTKKFKLVDPLRALELYGKAVGFYTDEPPPQPLSALEQASIATLLSMQRTIEARMAKTKELIDAHPR